MKQFYLNLVISSLFMMGSCEQNKKTDPIFDEANSIFSESLVIASKNHQIHGKDLYEGEFIEAINISGDSVINYVKFFEKLVDENFYFDGSTSISDLKELKYRYDESNLKFQKKGFDHFCQALNEWNDLYGKPDSEYAAWLLEHDYTRDEFEKDILEINIKFSQLCKIKSEKEKRKILQD